MKGWLRNFTVLSVLVVFLVTPAAAVVTTIINDLSPNDPGSIVEISNIKGRTIQPNLRIILNPGDRKRLTARNIYRFTLTRIFGDTREKYVVSCSKDPRVKDKITLRLVDIQSNSMPAGCMLERTGRWTRLDGVVWDRIPVTTRRSH